MSEILTGIYSLMNLPARGTVARLIILNLYLLHVCSQNIIILFYIVSSDNRKMAIILNLSTSASLSDPGSQKVSLSQTGVLWVGTFL